MGELAVWLLIVAFASSSVAVLWMTAGGLCEIWRRMRLERASRPLRLRVDQRIDLAGDAFLIALRPAWPWRWLPAFRAGQHVVVHAASRDPRGISRAYSLAAWEARPRRYVLGIKRQDDGVVSRWLADNVRCGLELVVERPKGSFYWQPASELVLVAGGIGITPMRAMIHACLHSRTRRPVTLHFSASFPEQLYFHEEFRSLEAENEWFVYRPRITRDTSNWSGARGRMTAADILVHVNDPRRSQFFICAGQAMEQTIIAGLSELGVRPDQIRHESFGLSASRNDIEAAVTYRGRTFAFAGAPTLLHALIEQGFSIPSECRSGECGRCRLSIVRGKARNILTSAEELESTLTCCAVPVTDIELAG